MYCPECGSEYREGFFQCADCEVPLVDTPPEPTPHPDVGLVTVLETSDPGAIAVAESLLLEEKVPYFKQGDQIQDFIGIRIGGFNPIAGPVQIQVAEEHAEAALEILAGLTSGEIGELEQPVEPE